MRSIANSLYYVRDSILRERLADPAYGGDESYRSQKTKTESPPHLIWTGAALFPRRIELQRKSYAPCKVSTTPIPSQERRSWIPRSSTTATSAMTIVRQPMAQPATPSTGQSTMGEEAARDRPHLQGHGLHRRLWQDRPRDAHPSAA